jgi:hypothetical protein
MAGISVACVDVAKGVALREQSLLGLESVERVS